MTRSTVSDIRREQKKSLFFREITTIIHRLTESEPTIARVYPTRIDFSADSGICYVYFATFSLDNTEEQSEAVFKEALSRLKLYRPSIRKALATALNARYTPDLLFLFDTKREKQQHIEQLLSKVHEELSLSDNSNNDNDEEDED